MNNADMPAAPLANSSTDFINSNLSRANGLTKREYFAAMAMQGLYSSNENHKKLGYVEMAEASVAMADALLEELE